MKHATRRTCNLGALTRKPDRYADEVVTGFVAEDFDE